MSAGEQPLSAGAARARQIELEAAQRRVIERLKATAHPPRSPAKRTAIIALGAVLFAAAFAARIAVSDPGALLANFYIVPIAILAIEFGVRAGLLAAAIAFALVPAWGVISHVDIDALGYVSRGAAFLLTGVVVGRFSDRLRQDAAVRQDAQRDLALYADQLESSNRGLARSVERLEAFAEIARTVGGETELDRVLKLILAQGREIVAAHTLVMYLPEGGELVAVSGSAMRSGSQQRLSLNGSVAGEVLLSGQPQRLGAGDRAQLAQLAPEATAAILVPLAFRGEPLGVLSAINAAGERAFEDEDEQLLMSVAASAATAVATARSVAAARLRLSLEAADQARARWARELHDETLQGLTGVRMVLSAGLARDDVDALRGAAETADAHLADEMRKLRDLIAELRPAALDDLGLGPAIETLAKRQAAVGAFAVDVDIELESSDRRLDRESETAVYRIVQEALSNAVKHAGADHVSLRVRQLPDRVQVAVEDDGRGFDPDGVRAGFGLTGMRERALLAGGRLWVTSAAGGPTRVAAVLPLPLPR